MSALWTAGFVAACLWIGLMRGLEGIARDVDDDEQGDW
jgi:hypothetical protein